MDKYKSIIVILVAICLIMGTALATYLSIGNQHTEVVQVANIELPWLIEVVDS